MDIVSLARFQFAMTTVFHFFFVPFSIGTVFMVAIMETLYVKKKDETYLKMAKFWGNIFLLSFAVGVVTGIIQEFQFGMNWSDYSRFVGDIFGAPLAVEALLSFFIESTFIGLWMSTWDRFKPKFHCFLIWMVVFGTVTSSIWILIANGFMQHPVGYTLRNGRAEMTDFGALVTNPQAWMEIGHVLTAAVTMGGIVIAGLAAFQLLKKDKLSELATDIYRRSVKIGLTVSLIGSVAVMLVGDIQMKALVNEQPMKFAATEAVYEDTGDKAPWTVIAWADEKEHKNVFNVDIPGMLSWLTYSKATGAVKGMNTINKELSAKYGKDIDYYPPVNALFWTFRIMAGFGALLFLVSAVGLFFTRKKKPILFEKKWMLWIVGLMTFSPLLANTSGWLVTELGRYPWTVYGLFTIKDSVSPNVSTTSLLISNTVYFLIFTSLAIAMISLVVRELRKGPDRNGAQLSDGFVDPFDKGAY